MRSHTRLAVIVACALVVVTALVDFSSLPWATPVLPALAWLLTRTRWTDLACLRVVQLGAAGQAVAVAAAVTGAPFAVAVPGLALLCLAATATGYGVIRFPVKR